MRRAALLAILCLTGCTSNNPRDRAIRKALDFIDRSASDPRNFADYGADYLFCFYTTAASTADPELRDAAARIGRKHAKRWAATKMVVTPNASADEVGDMVEGWYAASRLGQDDSRIKPVLRDAAARFAPVDFLLFDPAKEPPPSDRKASKYSIWLDALIATYMGEQYGIPLGGSYSDVLKWLPLMRPYPPTGQGTYINQFYDVTYAITHLVYTQNDYGVYAVPRVGFGPEFEYLHRNLALAVESLHDPETVGEFLDSLKAFGLGDDDPAIRKGTQYLLETQQPDGSWTPPDVADAYTRYHSAWTGMGGLQQSRWLDR